MLYAYKKRVDSDLSIFCHFYLSARDASTSLLVPGLGVLMLCITATIVGNDLIPQKGMHTMTPKVLVIVERAAKCKYYNDKLANCK